MASERPKLDNEKGRWSDSESVASATWQPVDSYDWTTLRCPKCGGEATAGDADQIALGGDCDDCVRAGMGES